MGEHVNITHDRLKPSGAITLLTIVSSATDPMVDGGALGGGRCKSSDLIIEVIDAACDEARRQPARTVWRNIMSRVI
jgi:hypothetical protein